MKQCKTCNKSYVPKALNQLYCRYKCQPSRLNSKKKYRKKVRKILKFIQPISKLYRQEITLIYDRRPDGLEVDHIIPINGENVSGLHVPWNLQYLTPDENNKKSNKT